MTAEEFVVDLVNVQSKRITCLEDLICEKNAEISERNQDLRFLIDLLDLTETKTDAYYEMTVWKDDKKGLFDRITDLKSRYTK